MSDAQFDAVSRYLESGGTAWLRLPFGTHDERGFLREMQLEDTILSAGYAGLVVLENEQPRVNLMCRIAAGFAPRIRVISGDERWAVRLRAHPDGVRLHLQNRALEAETSEEVFYLGGDPVLTHIHSTSREEPLELELSATDLTGFNGMLWMQSPELGEEKRKVEIETTEEGKLRLRLDLSGVRVYAVVRNDQI